ncbi:MAG TPA: TIGR00341 family protein [Acidobacteriota bacterium]|nr:TIGR00341 family protein [Acidobacteriota bacterium]
MSLRLLEITGPKEEIEGVPDLLEEIPLVHLWTSAPENATRQVRILLDAQQVESVSDKLLSHFGSDSGFRLTSLPVEATIPAAEQDEEEKDSEGDKQESKDSGPKRISREELYQDLSQASRLTPVYLAMVGLSTVVAAVGLIRGEVAIIIGAMVIAPLLGPNVALSLACTLGDPKLAKRSMKAIAAGLVTAVALSLLAGALLNADPREPQLALRTGADVGDIILALAAGGAGSLAFTSGVPAVVVGVMVAVALLPPLVTAGLLVGAGYPSQALGALMLTLTNVTCVNLAAVATFLIQKVRPRTWWETKRARKATRIAAATWITMLAVLLGLMLAGYVKGV